MKRALVVLVAAIVLGTGPAGGTVSGTNGRIAFFWGGNVLVMSATGSGARTLADGTAPAWSPDGRRIAFDSGRAGNFDVYVMAADGSGQTRLTSEPSTDYGAAWSPDGSRIAFTSDRNGTEDVFVIGAAGGETTRLTTDAGSERDPAWSPDGTRIAFTAIREGNEDVYVMRLAGGEVVRLTSDPAADGRPSWSPNGASIAFHSGRSGSFDVYSMRADGSDLRRLTENPSRDVRPAWSPDGRRILFESDRDADVWDRDVFVMAADGSGERRLRSGAVNGRGADWQPTVDLALVLSAPPVAPPGRSVPFRVTIRNLSPAAGTGLTVRVGSTVRRLARLEAGATFRVVIGVRPSRVGRLTVRASVEAAQADPVARNGRAAAVTTIKRR